MNRRLVYLWLPFLLVGVVWAEGALPPQTLEGSFRAGNALYLNRDFAGAVTAYEAQVRRGEYSANLFYNLGDAYYQRGDRGHAALNYERALLLDPSHAEAAANLAFLRGRPVTVPGGSWNWNAVATLAAVTGWLGVAGLIAAVAVRGLRPVGLGMAALGFLACAVGAGSIWLWDDGGSNAARAVVVADSTPALYAPADNAKVVTTLLAGGSVNVLSEQGPWTYTLLSDGAHAWIASDRIEKLVPAAPVPAGPL